jgi:TonB-linked SusC/RagA family outer membrane protein
MATAQTRTISGTVLSGDDGEPLVGASVSVKGKNLGTATNQDGKFVLANIPVSEKSLIVAYLGYETQEVSIADNLQIVLKLSHTTLDEVVVTALGISREKKSLGYAATTITSDDINATGNRSAINALQGKVPGMEIVSASGAPGASSRVVLRGIATLGGSGSIQPLYVIDGVPVSNGVTNNTDLNNGYDFGNRANDINPNDIESVTVLKGGSATALYGSRATGGAIIIVTKSGAKSKGKAKIDVSSTTTFENTLKLPTFQNEFGQGWYNRDTYYDLMENGSWGPRFDGKVHPWGFVVDNQQQIKPYVAMQNNVKDFFDVGFTTNNNISISNGDDNKSYYVSYGNISSDGIMPSPSDAYKRNNIALRGTTKFLKIFTSSASLNYVRKDSKFVITGQDQSVLDAVWQTPRDINIVDLKDYNNKFNNVDNYYTIYSQNPYYVLNEHGTKYGEDRIYGNVGLDAAPLSWLTVKFKVGSDIANSTLKAWRAITKSARADYNNETGSVAEASWRTSELNTDFMLDIHKRFDFDLSLNAILGHNFNQRDARAQATSVQGLDIPFFYNLSNSASQPTIAESISQRRLVGAYANVDLGYKDLVYLNLTARNDWSSTLPADNRSFFYPSASLSFIFSELIEKNDILSFGKIRFGIGQTGKDADPYLIYPSFSQASITDGYRTQSFPVSTASGDGVNGFSVSNLIGNDKLQPEITTEKEIGLDLRFFNSRVNFDVAYYDKTTTDLIWQVPISAATGYTYQTMNLGKITNKGWELAASFVPVETKDLKWEINVNYSKNKNLLVELTNGLEQITLAGTSSVTLVSRPGYPIGLFEATVPATDPDGHIIVNNQGLPTFKDEKEVVGNSQNDFRIGGGTTLTFKGISLRAVVDYRKGGLMYSRDAEILYFTGNTPYTTYNDRQPFIVPNSVQKIGDTYVENTTPVAGFSNNMNLYYNQTYNAGIGGAYSLVDKTFFKLRELSIGYSLPKSLLQQTVLNSVDVALVGTNLFIWTPNSNLFGDPEATTFGNEIGANYGNFGATPSTRSLGFNIKVSF